VNKVLSEIGGIHEFCGNMGESYNFLVNKHRIFWKKGEIGNFSHTLKDVLKYEEIGNRGNASLIHWL